MIKFVNSFKSYLAKEIVNLLKQDSRKYLLPLLRSKTINDYRIWRPGNWPVLIETEDFFQQKLNYIHENPVLKGYVDKEDAWLYSSARNYYNDDHSIIEVTIQ
jgi:REP element-mobilizing transposase RayT